MIHPDSYPNHIKQTHGTALTAYDVILEHGMDGLPKAVEILYNEAMKIDRERYIKAAPYERTEERVTHSNGFKHKAIRTRIGTLELQVPQTRDSSYYPSFLEQGVRSEKALKISLAEMYVQGVSTRKVSAIIEKLCGYQVTSSEVSQAAKLLDDEFKQWRERPLGNYQYLFLDARYEKVREGGQVIDMAVLIAAGVNDSGQREILGVSVSLSEAETHWRAFLEGLQKRGLIGLKMIISDDHSGLKSARKAVFPGVSWQRCQFHLQQNAQSYVPKKDMQEAVAFDIKKIFLSSSKEEANEKLKQVIKKYETTAPKLSKWMEIAIPEGLTVMSCPEKYRKQLRTNNLLERENREIKRRTRVVGIFPNTDSCLRLVTALVIEKSEEWLLGKKYFSI